MNRNKFGYSLFQEYEKRKSKNPSYSLRAYAKLLGVDQSSLSKFFKGERSFSQATIDSCLAKLGLDESTRKSIEDDIKNRESEYIVQEDEVIKLLGHWKYWAILEFFKTVHNHEVSTISGKLGLTKEDTQKCIDELIQLNFISFDNGRYSLLKPNNTWISNKKTTEARRQFQKMLLSESIEAIERVPIDFREHGSLTVAIDKKNLPAIKEKIRNFQKDLGKMIQKKGELNEVYQLTISFFPLSDLE